MEKATRWIIAKLIIIGIMITLLLFRDRSAATLSIVFSMIAVIALMIFLRTRYKNAYQADERTKKLSGYASAWSWMITLILVTFLYWLNYLDYIAWTADKLITIIFLTMVISNILFRIYFLRKTDI